MNFFRRFLAVMLVTVIATHPSFAGLGAPPPLPDAFGSPEIDPGMCMGALAFLSGAILVIRGRVKL